MRNDLLAIRGMQAADIDRGLALCRTAGWNQVRADWEFLVDGAQGWCAEIDGTVVGTVVLIDATWIAMMLVDQAFRKHGIGTALFEHALQFAAPDAGLDATELGEPLYRKYGFERAFDVIRWRVPAGRNHAVHAPFCIAAPPHRFEFRQGSNRAFTRHGHSSEHCGPVFSDSPQHAAELLDSCLASEANRPWTLDTTATNEIWHAYLRNEGFEPARRFTRMYRGTPPPPDSTLYSTNGPEYGPTCIPSLS